MKIKPLLIMGLAVLSLGMWAERSEAAPGFKLTWSAPTTRADGTALPAAQIKGYNVYVQAPGATTSPKVNAAVVTALTYTYTPATMVTTGPYCFALTTVDTGDLESAQSDKFCIKYVNLPDQETIIIPVAPGTPSVNIKIEFTK